MSSYVPPPPCASNNGLYNCMQPELVEARHRAREIMYRYNNSPPTRDGRERREMLAELFCVPVESISGVYIEPPVLIRLDQGNVDSIVGRTNTMMTEVNLNFNQWGTESLLEFGLVDLAQPL